MFPLGNKSHTLPVAGRGPKPALPPKPIRSRSMTFTGTNRITNNNSSSNSLPRNQLTRLRGNSVDALLIDYQEPVGASLSSSLSPSSDSNNSLPTNYHEHPPMIPVPLLTVTDSGTSANVSNTTIRGQSNVVNDREGQSSTINDGEFNDKDKKSNINSDEREKATSISATEKESDKEEQPAVQIEVEEDKVNKVKPDRPPMPTRPPPPLSRPPRPFPPPPSRPSPSHPPPPSSSPSHNSPSINEAKLARKRPPPTPPLIIDSRSSPDHTPHSLRTFKEDSSPKNSVKSNVKSSMPKRPPPPTVSPIHQLVNVNDSEDSTDINSITNNSATSISSGINNSDKERSSDDRTNTGNKVTDNHHSVSSPHHSLGVIKEDRLSEEEEEEEEAEEEEREGEEEKEGEMTGSVVQVHEPVESTTASSSPHQSRKLLGKMTQSIRTFSKRRIKTVRE